MVPFALHSRQANVESELRGATALPSHLTLSRSGNAMLFDSTGKLTCAPANLLTQSNVFSNAAWTRDAGTTLTSGVSDPFGGTSAWTFTQTSAGTGYQIYRTSFAVPASVNGIISLWIRRRAGSAAIQMRGPDGATTAVTSQVSSSWARVYLAGTFPSGGSITVAVLLNAQNDSIDIYGYQIEPVTYQTTPSTYIDTTSAAYYGPRFDYDPSTLAAKGLLVEAAATNYVYQAFNLSDTAWAATGGSKASATDLSGGSTATTFTPTSIPGNHYINTSTGGSLTSGSTYTMRVYFKFGAAAYIVFGETGGSAWMWGSVKASDLSTSTSGTASASIKAPVSLGNGVYMVELTWVRDATGAAKPAFFPYTNTAASIGNAGYQSWTPAGTETITVLGFQIEAGSAGSSPIPTGGATVTRAAESLTAASYSTQPAILQYRPTSTGTRARKAIATYSSVSSESAEWIEKVAIYAPATPSALYNQFLTVDGQL